jgi:hypothetical protein
MLQGYAKRLCEESKLCKSSISTTGNLIAIALCCEHRAGPVLLEPDASSVEECVFGH